MSVKNWSVDLNIIKKYPAKYKVWKLEQMINFGLDGEKLKSSDLKKYLTELSIDPIKRKYLNFLLNNG